MISALFGNAGRSTNSRSIEDIVGDRKLIIYGAGNYYLYLKAFVLDPRHLIPAIVIDRKFGEPTTGVPVQVGPAHYQPSENDLKEAVVIISVSSPQDRPAIVAYLEGLGFSHIVGAEDIYEVNLNPKAQARCGGNSFYRDLRREILAAYDLMEDEESREVFLAVARTHIQRCPQHVPCHPVEEQYFPADLPLSKGGSRLIICGAYDGDTARAAYARWGRMDALACFEPDAKTFQELAEFCASKPAIAGMIALFPCAVGDREEIKGFQADIGKSSRLDSDASDTVQCLSIDRALPRFRPTRITMDVEGAEPGALLGAATTLKQSRPDLAICVYHEPEHLWEIPLWLDSLGLGYKFYLRNYTGAVVETVLYAATERST